MTDLDSQLYAIWQKYSAKDYWGDAVLVEQNIAERDRALVANPSLQDLPTDKDIEQFYHYRSLGFVHERTTQVERAISVRDLQWLTDNVRYDQRLTLELFTLVTGRKVKGLSNEKLTEVFVEVIATQLPT